MHDSFFASLQNSPESPSFLPRTSKRSLSRNKSTLKPLGVRNINTLQNYDSLSGNNSPTTTLAVDLSANFHIDSSSRRDFQSTPHKALGSGIKMHSPQNQLSSFDFENGQLDLANRTFTLEDTEEHRSTTQFFGQSILEDNEDQESPSLNRELSSRSSSSRNPPFLDRSTARSSRTTSNASISSNSSITSFSSIDSNPSIISSATAITGFTNPKKTLRRAKTSILGNMRPMHSYSSSHIDKFKDPITKNLESDDEGDDTLDQFCVPSPIPERSFIQDDENNNNANDNDNDYLSGLNKREIGSPIQKKQMKSKVRRIHSMFYSKKEITDTTNMFGNLMNSPKLIDQDNNESNLSNSLLANSKIETFTVENDSIPRINVSTLCKILDNHYKDFFDEVLIVDCRFEYEYKGGHIQGSINVSSQSELEEKFLHNRHKQGAFEPKKRTLIIFHCEFSSYRGPLMASHLRTCDRNINQDNYPHLDYPDILVLEGGYKKFFDLQSSRCYPQKYVEMNDNNHKNVCEKELTRFKRDLKRASSFNNLSFAASMNSSSSSLSNPTSSSHSSHSSIHRLHRRTMTSGNINFTRRPSKSHALDFSRSTSELPLSSEFVKKDDSKPPEILNFGFKFPLMPKKNDNDTSPSQRGGKKLSRSLTTSMI